MRVPAEQQRGLKHICGVETAPRRERARNFEGFKLLHLHSAHRKSLDAVCKKKKLPLQR